MFAIYYEIFKILFNLTDDEIEKINNNKNNNENILEYGFV